MQIKILLVALASAFMLCNCVNALAQDQDGEQPLGDVARQSKAVSTQHKAKKIYTNDDMPAVSIAADGTVAHVNSGSLFDIPDGVKSKVVFFEDLGCRDAAAADSGLRTLRSDVYHFSLVRHDYSMHGMKWSRKAHVYAAFFDTKSSDLGENFRRWVFDNQKSITAQNLDNRVAEFAAQSNIIIPANFDTTGEFSAKVDADYALGESLGITWIPTIYVLCNLPSGPIQEKVEDALHMTYALDRCNRRYTQQPPKVVTSGTPTLQKPTTH